MTDKTLPESHYPGHYSNKTQGLGRIVEKMFAPETMTATHRLDFLYESDYAAFRQALEVIRKASATDFHAYVAYLLQGTALSNETQTLVNNALSKQGYSLSKETATEIIRDWKHHSPDLSPTYQPPFKLKVGSPAHPVDRQYYEQVAAIIEKIRGQFPQFGKDLDTLLHENDGRNLVNPETWYKSHHPETEDKTARNFANAIKQNGLNGMDIAAASTYAEKKPFGASAPSISHEAEL